MKKFERNIIEADATLFDALKRLNELPGSEMTLFVVDSTDSRKVVGTLTDGDMRRALLAGRTLADKVTDAMHSDFMRLDADAADWVDEIRRMRRAAIKMAPVVGADGRMADIVDLAARSTVLPLRAILMAGGRGERLRPMTAHTPKPLLTIEGKAIIDYNIEALAAAGITDITVCTRYLAEKIHSHFAEPVAGVTVRCVTETIPMGTIGAAALVAAPAGRGGNTLIMNSDLLTTASFEDMYVRHRDSGADITVGVVPYQVSVPFAILDTDGDRVCAIEEKPSYSYYANAGIYIFRDSILDAIPADRPTDAPDLIRAAIEAGSRVTYYIINGTWIDIGSPTDFTHATQLMRNLRSSHRPL